VSSERVAPILPARSLAETRAFYERLGFTTVGWWPHASGGYAILVRGGLELHFFTFADLSPRDSYAQCYWRVPDVDALHADFARLDLPAEGMPRLTPVEEKPWGVREFALVDPNGTLVRIGPPLRA
jgi:catechol 2,3-dioxygenase-like lactoylglutathione lyase family enzyme